MPELPEVNQVVKQLRPVLLEQVISKVKLYSHWDRIPDDFRERAYQQTVREITRHGKYLFIHFDRDILMAHLGMSGWFRVVVLTEHHRKHDHYALLSQSANCKVLYHDPRRFGQVGWVPAEAQHQVRDLERFDLPAYHLGIDALNPGLDPKHGGARDLWDQWFFSRLLPGSSVKFGLLQQGKVAGIGNIYASEILFASRIHPETEIGALTRYQKRRLIKASWKILRAAVKYGGTTISGANKYRDPTARFGRYSEYLAVYGRGGRRCYNCRDRIVKTKLKARATYHCPTCQSR